MFYQGNKKVFFPPGLVTALWMQARVPFLDTDEVLPMDPPFHPLLIKKGSTTSREREREEEDTSFHQQLSDVEVEDKEGDNSARDDNFPNRSKPMFQCSCIGFHGGRSTPRLQFNRQCPQIWNVLPASCLGRKTGTSRKIIYWVGCRRLLRLFSPVSPLSKSFQLLRQSTSRSILGWVTLGLVRQRQRIWVRQWHFPFPGLLIWFLPH